MHVYTPHVHVHAHCQNSLFINHPPLYYYCFISRLSLLCAFIICATFEPAFRCQRGSKVARIINICPLWGGPGNGATCTCTSLPLSPPLPPSLPPSLTPSLPPSLPPSPSLPPPQHTLVQPGESLAISLLALDQVNNSREAVWSLEAPNQDVVSWCPAS